MSPSVLGLLSPAFQSSRCRQPVKLTSRLFRRNATVTRSHFSQSPRHNFFCSSEATSRGLPAGSAELPSGIAELLLSPHDAGPVIPKTPSLPPLPTGASQLTPPQSPLAADAGKGRQLSPKTATDRRRRQHFSDRLWGPSTSHQANKPGDGRRIRRQHKYGKHLPSACQPATAADARLPPPTPGLLEPTNSSCSNSNNLPSKPGGRYANDSGVLASK